MMHSEQRGIGSSLDKGSQCTVSMSRHRAGILIVQGEVATRLCDSTKLWRRRLITFDRHGGYWEVIRNESLGSDTRDSGGHPITP